MPSLSATYSWTAALSAMHEGLTRQLAGIHPALSAIDIYGDEDGGLLTAELLAFDGDRRATAWLTAGHLAAVLWNEGDDWLPALGVDCTVSVGGLSVTTPCAAMTRLSTGTMTPAQWLATSTVEIGPAEAI